MSNVSDLILDAGGKLESCFARNQVGDTSRSWDGNGLRSTHRGDDREQVDGSHLLLITLKRTQVDSRGRRWSLDSPNTQLSGPMMDASEST